MVNHVDIIENALSVSKSRITDKYDYALYHSLEMPVLCAQYFKYLNKTEIRNKIVRHIKAKRNRSGESIPPSFMREMLDRFVNSKGRLRIAIGTAVKELKDEFGAELLKEFFNNQVLSANVSDRKRAYVVAMDVYDKDTESRLWEAWEIFHDNNCMEVLAKMSSPELLETKFVEIWNSDNIAFYIKNNVLKKVAARNFGKLAFLKEDYPVSYLSACVAAKVDISDSEAIQLAKRSTKINELGYSLWCLGSLGKTDALYKLLSESDELEKAMPKEFWEYYEDMYDLSK